MCVPFGLFIICVPFGVAGAVARSLAPLSLRAFLPSAVAPCKKRTLLGGLKRALAYFCVFSFILCVAKVRSPLGLACFHLVPSTIDHSAFGARFRSLFGRGRCRSR